MNENMKPRYPNAEEINEITDVLFHERYGRYKGKKEWEWTRKRVEEMYIAVFENYVGTNKYYRGNYCGKVLVLVDDYGLDNFRLFKWVRGKPKWVPQESALFDEDSKAPEISA